MLSPSRGEKDKENTKDTLEDTFIQSFDECSRKINRLSNSVPVILEKAKTFQNASDELSQLVVQMKNEIPYIQQQSQQALAPILPLYRLRTKVFTLFCYI